MSKRLGKNGEKFCCFVTFDVWAITYEFCFVRRRYFGSKLKCLFVYRCDICFVRRRLFAVVCVGIHVLSGQKNI